MSIKPSPKKSSFGQRIKDMFFRGAKPSLKAENNIIQNQQDLLAICKKVKNGDIVAIDTEFMRVRTYYPILCLVQINIHGECFAIDTLSKNLNLKPLFDIIENNKVTKIFHSTRQDLEVIYQIIKKVPKGIVDTQIMANFCNLDFNTSYAKLVKKFFGKDLDKELQRSDWKKRPLTKEQIKYALIDVLYLPKIYDYLKSTIEKEGKLAWFNEEMKRVLLADNYDVDNGDLYKKFSSINKSPTYRNITELLIPWRDEIARRRDIPRSFVVKDDVINKIARSDPKNMEELESCYEKSRFDDSKTKTRILDLLNNREENKDDPIVKVNFRLNPQQEVQYEEIKSLLQKKSKIHNLKPQFVISQNDLRQIIVGYVNVEDVVIGWRYEVFGKDLKEYLDNLKNDKD